MTVSQIPSNYYTQLANIESSNNPNAKASTSSASGLYQFIKSTGSSLGLPWGNNTALPFGGASVSVGQQNTVIQTFTQNNANALNNAGIDITSQNLYAAHFLGTSTAINILNAPDGTKVSSVVGSNVIAANPFLANMDVGDFASWLDKKMGAVNISDAVNAVPQLVGSTINSATAFVTPTISGLTNDVANVVAPVYNAGASAISGVTDGVTGAVAGVTNAVSGFSTAVSSFQQFFVSLFSIQTWARVTIVVIGLGLLLIAVVAITNSNNGGGSAPTIVPIPV